MDDILTQLKVDLAIQLEKHASSLEELEESLSSIDKAGGAIKVAKLLSKLAFGEKEILGGVGTLAGGAWDIAKTIPEIGMTTALMAGATLGAGAYGIKKHMENQDTDLQNKQNEVDRIRTLTGRLQSDYGIHHG